MLHTIDDLRLQRSPVPAFDLIPLRQALADGKLDPFTRCIVELPDRFGIHAEILSVAGKFHGTCERLERDPGIVLSPFPGSAGEIRRKQEHTSLRICDGPVPAQDHLYKGIRIRILLQLPAEFLVFDRNLGRDGKFRIIARLHLDPARIMLRLDCLLLCGLFAAPCDKKDCCQQ